MVVFFGCLLYVSPIRPQSTRVRRRPPSPFMRSCSSTLESKDIYIRCTSVQSGVASRQSVRLTQTGDIESWGISPDATLLALVRLPAPTHAVLEVVDLRTGRKTRSEATDRRNDLNPTCGTIILRTYSTTGSKGAFTFTDLLAGRNIPVAASTLDLRCDDIRTHTLELTNQNALYLASPRRLIATNVKEFNISPDGEHIAYSSGDKLCAGPIAGAENPTVTCLGMTWTAGSMIVANDGTVRFTEQTSEGCKFNDLDDPCPAIFSWKPGDPNDQLLAFKGSDPHDISSEAGFKIIALHNKWPVNNIN
jgi:hypothetical protein